MTNTELRAAAVVDLNARRQPVTYTVILNHHWDGRVEATVCDVSDDPRSRASVAEVLRQLLAQWDTRTPAENTAPNLRRLADALEAATPATEALRARIAELEAALRRISAGEGYYGAQAAEYKAIARAALDGNP